MTKFESEMQTAYSCQGDAITLGAALQEHQCFPKVPITIPVKMLNRHGLITGATGTGKTKTIQLMAEELSAKGIPVLLMDIKGDLSGLAKAGESTDKIVEREKKLNVTFEGKGFPVEFLTLSGLDGVRLRATIAKFGPLLIAKILELNDTQSGIISLIFQYCSDKNLPLLDLKDLKKILTYLSEHEPMAKEYGTLSKASVGTILRKLIVLEQQGAENIFGEPAFDVLDLLRCNDKGQGYISILRLADIQDKPKLFSTFMLALLAEIYATFPEVGDLPKPKLALFFDEAHLVFDEASKALLDQIEGIVRLIRSKGVGVFFCTQSATDIPKNVLGQLGLKIQHALRAFTAADRKNIKLTAENFPPSDYYKTDQLLTELGIGEALITALNEKGAPTPLISALIKAPSSSLGILSDEEIKAINQKSSLVKKYATTVESKSAYEILNEQAPTEKKEKSSVDKILGSTTVRQICRTVARELTRTLLVILGIGRRR